MTTNQQNREYKPTFSQRQQNDSWEKQFDKAWSFSDPVEYELKEAIKNFIRFTRQSADKEGYERGYKEAREEVLRETLGLLNIMVKEDVIETLEQQLKLTTN